MERTEATLGTEQARLQASRALEQWTKCALEDVDGQILEGKSSLDITARQAILGINAITAEQYVMRTDDIANIVDAGREKIERTQVPEDDKQQLRGWFNDYFATNVMPKEEQNTHQIQENNKTANLHIQERVVKHEGVIDQQRKERGARISTDILPGIAFTTIENRIDDMTKTITTLLQVKQVDLQTLTQAKLTAHKALAQSKRASLAATLANTMQKLEGRIAVTEKNNTTRARHEQRTNSSEERFASGGARGARAERPDPRIQTLMGKATGLQEQPFVTVLKNIDHHRGNGKTDEEIYRLLARNFHPDSSKRENAIDVMKVLSMSYDRQQKAFIV